MDEDKKTKLVKDALYWIVGDVRYLHHATGLFQKELSEMNRLREAVRKDSKSVLNTTAHITNKSHVDRIFTSINDAAQFEEHVVADIRAQQARLEALSTSDLEAEVTILIQRNKDQKEAERLFNREENQLRRLSFWVRKSVWSPQEAILIFSGREPTSDVISSLEKTGHFEREESPFASAYFTTFELLKSAIEIGEISSPGRPLEYLNWYEKILGDVDDEIRRALLEIHDPDQLETVTRGEAENTEQLSELEQRSLLKIVAAMAIKGYRFDPEAKRNQATADIQTDAHLLGLELDPKTILKWLRKACETVPDDHT